MLYHSWDIMNSEFLVDRGKGYLFFSITEPDKNIGYRLDKAKVMELVDKLNLWLAEQE